jgi:WD40 repeat protein
MLNLLGGIQDPGGGDIRVWDLVSGQVLRTYAVNWMPGGPVFDTRALGLQFSPDGRSLAAVGKQTAGPGADSKWVVQIFDVSTPQASWALRGHTSPVPSVAFSADGNLVASAGEDGTVQVWDVPTSQAVLTTRAHGEQVQSVVFGADGRRLASAGKGGVISFWDVRSGKAERVLQTGLPDVHRIAFSPGGGMIASQSAEGVKVWDTTTGKLLREVLGSSNSVTFSPDAKRLAIPFTVVANPGEAGIPFFGGVKAQGGVRIVDASSGAVVAEMRSGTEVGPAPKARETLGVGELLPATEIVNFSDAAYSPDGRRLAVAASDGSVRLLDAGSLKEIGILRGHGSPVTSVVFSPDGQRLFSASMDQTIKVWDVENELQILTLRGHSGPVTSLALSPDGGRLVSAGADGTVRIWDGSVAPAGSQR